MTDSDLEQRELSLRARRTNARDLAYDADDPNIAWLRKVRREMWRECDYDPKKYARYVEEQAEIGLRKHGMCIREDETGQARVMKLKEGSAD